MSAIESPVADSIYDTANFDINGRIGDEIITIVWLGDNEV